MQTPDISHPDENPYKFASSDVAKRLPIAVDHLPSLLLAGFDAMGMPDACVSFVEMQTITEEGFTRTWHRPVLVFDVTLPSAVWRVACSFNGTKFIKTSPGATSPTEDANVVEAIHHADNLCATGKRVDGHPVIRDGMQDVMRKVGAMTTPDSVVLLRCEDNCFFVAA